MFDTETVERLRKQGLQFYRFPQEGDMVRIYLFCDSCKEDYVYSSPIVYEGGVGGNEAEIDKFMEKVISNGIRRICKCRQDLEIRFHLVENDEDFITNKMAAVQI